MLQTSEILRGFTDTLILAHLFSQDSYGYKLNKSISLRSNNSFEFKEATLYTSFRRLEECGYISSYWGDENSGARRRYYSITDSGKTVYKENLHDWNVIRTLIDTLIQIENKQQKLLTQGDKDEQQN